jgi:hypothetical protein
MVALDFCKKREKKEYRVVKISKSVGSNTMSQIDEHRPY